MTLATPTRDVVAALRNRLLTQAAGLPTEAAWENVDYVPKPGTAYYADMLLNTDVSRTELGNGLKRLTILWQVMINWPYGAAVLDPLAVGDEIQRVLWLSPLALAGNADPVYVSRVRVGPGRPNPPNWYQLAVTIMAWVDY